jgi:hypothetical protein
MAVLIAVFRAFGRFSVFLLGRLISALKTAVGHLSPRAIIPRIEFWSRPMEFCGLWVQWRPIAFRKKRRPIFFRPRSRHRL